MVTSFVIALHPVPPVCWSGALTFSFDKIDAVLDAINTLKSEESTPDTCGLLGIIRNADGSNVSSLHVLPVVIPETRIRDLSLSLITISL